LSQLQGDWSTSRARAETARGLAREGGFVQLVAWADVMRGWALVQAGDGEPGLAAVRDGMATITASESKDFVTYFLGLLAESLARAGEVESALDVVTEALTVAATCGERFYEAELHRLKGELLQDSGAEPARSQECFTTALAIARRQRALGLERRIRTSPGGTDPGPA
jgi:predicted ATPase